MTRADAMTALTGVILECAAGDNRYRFYSIGNYGVTDTLANPAEAARIAYHLVRSNSAPEWVSAPGHLREVVRHIRTMDLTLT